MEKVGFPTRPASFHCVIPPMPTDVSATLVPFLSVGAAGPSSPATFRPLEGITCTIPAICSLNRTHPRPDHDKAEANTLPCCRLAHEALRTARGTPGQSTHRSLPPLPAHSRYMAKHRTTAANRVASLTSKVALEANSREPCVPGGTNTRLKLSLKTGLWKVSVWTTMPPVMSTTGFISARPTCIHAGKLSRLLCLITRMQGAFRLMCLSVQRMACSVGQGSIMLPACAEAILSGKT